MNHPSTACQWQSIIKFWVGVGLLLSVTACTRDNADLLAYMAEVKARPETPIEPIPEMKPYLRFIYPGHEVNPFDPKILAPDKQPAQGSGVMPDANRAREFLEGFPLDSLRMVGTVNQGKELWALIRIPDGAVHRVRAGNYLGKNHGKVLKVEELKVTLQELVENGFGGYKERENTIALSDKDEAKQ